MAGLFITPPNYKQLNDLPEVDGLAYYNTSFQCNIYSVIKRKEQKVNSQKGKCFMHIAK